MSHAETPYVMHHDVRGSSPYSVRSIEVVAKTEYDTLLAENQRLRDTLDYLLPANGCHTVEEALAAFAPTDGTPSADQ